QPVVGPVEILEDEHHPPVGSEPFDETAPRGEGLATAVAAQPLRALETDERPEVRLDPVPRGRVVDERCDGAAHLALDDLRRIALEDPGVLLHQLAERREADAGSVREAPPLTPDDPARVA